MSTASSRTRCSQFSIKEIKAATNQFDSSNIIGQGGEAIVYFAEIYIGSNKTLVAVKRLKDNSKEFEREIHTLSKIQHPNLVSLIGYCNESGHKILVYEYMAKGCLSDYLKKKSSVTLSWLQRLNICLGAARGLQHLHSETDEFPKGIIHRDVKPANILVDENWVGKLSDFGMFKLSNAGQDKSMMTTNLKGTSGYYAPEYIKNRRITRKIDVYAFGVVLFEVICQKMPWDREDESYYADEDEDLGAWAQKNVDSLIQAEIKEDSLIVFTDIIGRSLQANPGRRPSMDDVVLDLQRAVECQEYVYLFKQSEGSSRATKRPVGILAVKVVRAMKLKKKGLLGASDPYVKLKLTEDKLPSKKTTVKQKNLNPEWNEEFTFVVKDPESQALELNVFDWEQVGKHDKMGLNVVLLKELTAEEPRVLTIDLLKNLDPNDVQNEKSRGQVVIELVYNPFKDNEVPAETEDPNAVQKAPEGTPETGGLLVVIIHEAQDLEGKNHSNPSVRLLFREEEGRTKSLKENRDPRWDEEFWFMSEEPPTNDRLHLEVVSTSKWMGLLHPKEILGYVDIHLSDVVSNKRINEWYNLIDSKNGRIQVELQWRTSS